MDSVYGIYNNYSSSKFKIKEYFQKYSKELTDEEANNPCLNHEKKKILDIMEVNIEEDEFELLSTYCSIDHLTVPNEMPKITHQRMRHNIFDNSEHTADINLKTVQEAQIMSKKYGYNKRTLKYLSELFIKYEKVDTTGSLAESGKDIFVYVRVYKPFVHAQEQSKRYKGPNIALDCVIEILGSQMLAQLRDKIQCLSDLSISTEISNHPDTPPGILAKDVYKSGFFYIEDTFYNDTRDPENIDYSSVIREWAKSKNIGPFKTASMENTRIDSLCVRFGFPWVYQHQGNCEHLIVLSDARLVNANDELAVSAYPRIHRLKPRSAKYCMMCGEISVRWVTKQSDRIPHDPSFFCDMCFKSYNYIDGKKVGSFLAYPYPCYPDLLEDHSETESSC